MVESVVSEHRAHRLQVLQATEDQSVSALPPACDRPTPGHAHLAHGLLHQGHWLPWERTLEAEKPLVPPGKDSDQCLQDRGEDPVGARRREDEDDVGRVSKEMKGEEWSRDDGGERTR